MNFLSPLNWLWLPPLAGGILLLWMVRPRRVERTVPSLYLWRALIAETPANAPLQKLRRRWLLFLQIALACLLTLALARPYVLAHVPPGHVYVFVLDNSVSMQAVDISPSRLQAAQKAASEFIQDEMRPQDQALVVSTSPRPQLLCLVTSEKSRLLDAIASAAPTDAGGDMDGALALARSLSASRMDIHTRVYTDGIAPAAAATSGEYVRQITFGSPHPDNVAVSGISAVPASDGIEAISVRVSQEGLMPHRDLTLSLSVNANLVDARKVAFVDGTDVETFTVPISSPNTIVTARLEKLRDAAAADDSASLILSPVSKTHTLLVTSGDFFLERGLLAVPQVTLRVATPAQFASLQDSLAQYDVIVLDGDFPSRDFPRGRYLTVNRYGSPAPLTAETLPLQDDTAITQDHTHPLMEFVDLSGMHLRVSHHISLAAGGQSLAAGKNGPLIAVDSQSGRRVVSIAFPLLDSDWPLRVSFPLFLANAVNWLMSGTLPGTVETQYAAGTLATVNVTPGARSLHLIRPDGKESIVAAPLAGGIATLDDTAQAGIYHVRGPNGMDYPLAVNARSFASLAPRRQSALNQVRRATLRPASQQVRREWGTSVAILCLFLLCGEWWVYHRRS